MEINSCATTLALNKGYWDNKMDDKSIHPQYIMCYNLPSKALLDSTKKEPFLKAL